MPKLKSGDAILDRVPHHACRLTVKGESLHRISAENKATSRSPS